MKSGCEPIDFLLDGGYESDVVTTIHGPSGSGKTNIALLAALSAAEQGKKVIFIDTEGGVSVERARQMRPNAEELLQKVFFLSPTTFKEQQACIARLDELMNEHIGLIVIDSVVMLYRLELGKREGIHEVNRALGAQVGVLTRIARKHHIPVLLTNQVYSSFDDTDRVNPVGGDVLKYGSKCLIELQILARGRRAILQKHRHLAERDVCFTIVQNGLELMKERKSFSLF